MTSTTIDVALIASNGTVKYSTTPLPPADPPTNHAVVIVHAVAVDSNPDASRCANAFCGTILSVGAGSSDGRWYAGMRVIGRVDGRGKGGLAEVITIALHRLHKAKTSLTDEENAAVAAYSVLACRALQLAQLPSAGHPRIFIHGLHTPLGLFATQAAKAFGCVVEGSAPMVRGVRDRLVEFGVDEFVDVVGVKGSSAGAVLGAVRGRKERNFDLVIDCLGDDTSVYDHVDEFTTDRARFITVTPQSISWKAVFRNRVTASPRLYLDVHDDHSKTTYSAYTGDAVPVTQNMTDEDIACVRELALAYNLVDNQNFLDVQIAKCFSFPHAQAAIHARLSPRPLTDTDENTHDHDNDDNDDDDDDKDEFGCVVIGVVDRNDARFRTITQMY
ncbi:hypothetical protein PYCC9005_005036 [Savitreella phatthalungensis]